MADSYEDDLQRFDRLWEAMAREGITVAALQSLYGRYKYLIMSRDMDTYRLLGPLLANIEAGDLPSVAKRVYELIAQTLSRPVHRSGNANALLHICGYLKTQLQPHEKRELLDAIEKYRLGEIAFDVPAMLLRAYFQRFPHAYIERQVFLFPP